MFGSGGYETILQKVDNIPRGGTGNSVRVSPVSTTFSDLGDGIGRLGNSLIGVVDSISHAIVTIADGTSNTAQGLVTGVTKIGSGAVSAIDSLGGKALNTGNTFLTGFSSIAPMLIVVAGGVVVMTVLNSEKIGSAFSQNINAYRR